MPALHLLGAFSVGLLLSRGTLGKGAKTAVQKAFEKYS